VRIDGLGTPNLPIAPLTGPAQAPNTQFNTTAQAAAQALQQEEQKGGGGGHGGGHGVKKPIDTIDEIAARASLNIAQRQKTMLERQAEIDRMKAAMAEEDQQVGDKEGNPDDQREEAGDDSGDENPGYTA
jgi:hypothetical protein